MILMMIKDVNHDNFKDADFDHKDEEGGECRVQTKVKYVAGFGQKQEERVDLGKSTRKGGGLIWVGT